MRISWRAVVKAKETAASGILSIITPNAGFGIKVTTYDS